MNDLSNLKPRRILACQLRQLGDVLLSTPCLELLKRRWPEAELHLLTEKKCLPLLEGNPNIDKIWAVDKKVLNTFVRQLKWYRQVASTHFDLVIDFQQLPRCKWVVFFSGAPVRLSYTPKWYNRPFYTHSAPLKPGYAAQTKASTLEPLGIFWNGERPRLYFSETEKMAVRKILADMGLKPGLRLITLDATHKHDNHRYPAEQYGKMVRALFERDPSLRFQPLWGPGEEAEVNAVINACPKEAIVLPPRPLTLREVGVCIGEADLHVGNCSAPRHMAVAVDTPSCCILGASSPVWTCPGPEHRHIALDLPCWPCSNDACSHLSCLRKLDPAIPVQVITEMLATVCPHRQQQDRS